MKLSNFFKKELIPLYLITLLGAVLRLQGIFTKSFAFTYDVGRDMLALRDLASLSHIPFIGPTTGIPGVFYGPWWYYMLTPFFMLFGGDPQGIAYVMAIIGICTIVLGYVLGNKIAGKFLGITFAVLISISPIMISLSSQIWNPNIAPFFAVLTLLVLAKIYSSKKNSLKTYFILGILLSLSLDIELFYGSMFSLGVIVSVLAIKGKKYTVNEICTFLIGIFLILLPRILFEIKNNFLMTKSLILFLSNGTQKSSFFESIPQRLIIFLNHFTDTILQSNRNLGLFTVIICMIVTLFFYKKLEMLERNFLKTCVVILFVFFIGTVFFSHDIWPHYLVGLPVFYLLILSIILNAIYKSIGKNPAIIILVFFVLYNFNPISFVNNLSKPLWEGDAAVYRNQLAVIDYVYKEANGSRFKYVVYTPTVNDYSYRYLFKWYGPMKYKYQASERANIAYFILEPDFQFPDRLTDWLFKRSFDGKIVKSKIVKGGVMVQTRIVK